MATAGVPNGAEIVAKNRAGIIAENRAGIVAENRAGIVAENRAWIVAENGVGNVADSVLLVIATLIATMTFQAGVNPPGGVWQESGGGNAGKAIFASQPLAFYVFVISNTIGLSTSIVVIIFLIIHRVRINGFPCYLAMGTATVALLVTYASAIVAVTPRDSVRFRHVLTAGSLPFIVWGFIHYLLNGRGNSSTGTNIVREIRALGDSNGIGTV